jgi:DNA polymerase III subunit chi
MAEVWFYHLEREPVENVLPGLLARGLQRELRMAVQGTDSARLAALSDRLWGHEDVAFLAHGGADDPAPEDQPIYLSIDGASPNKANYRFFVDGAEPESVEGLVRASIMFDGNMEDSLTQARALWKRFKAEGHAISYWKQDNEGRWKNQADG